jgi:hypothetical protein
LQAYLPACLPYGSVCRFPDYHDFVLKIRRKRYPFDFVASDKTFIESHILSVKSMIFISGTAGSRTDSRFFYVFLTSNSGYMRSFVKQLCLQYNCRKRFIFTSDF